MSNFLRFLMWPLAYQSMSFSATIKTHELLTELVQSRWRKFAKFLSCGFITKDLTHGTEHRFSWGQSRAGQEVGGGGSSSQSQRFVLPCLGKLVTRSLWSLFCGVFHCMLDLWFCVIDLFARHTHTQKNEWFFFLTDFIKRRSPWVIGNQQRNLPLRSFTVVLLRFPKLSLCKC